MDRNFKSNNVICATYNGDVKRSGHSIFLISIRMQMKTELSHSYFKLNGRTILRVGTVFYVGELVISVYILCASTNVIVIDLLGNQLTILNFKQCLISACLFQTRKIELKKTEQQSRWICLFLTF